MYFAFAKLSIVMARQIVTCSDRYEIGERVVKKVVRSDWRVRSGLVSRTVWMLVTPAVTVSIYDGNGICAASKCLKRQVWRRNSALLV